MMKMLIPVLIDVKVDERYCGITCRFLSHDHKCTLFYNTKLETTGPGGPTVDSVFRTKECIQKGIKTFEG